jgi:hypothetical protein
MLRRLFIGCLTILISFQFSAKAQVSVQEGWNHLDTILQKHVTADGLVDYINIKFTNDNYIAYNNAISAANLARFKGAMLKAHLINAYNFSVIKNVLRFYPTTSVAKIPGFFTDLKYPLGDKRYSLDQIEKEMLYDQFKDPRLHFVLNCGAISCPPLNNKSYRPQNLEQQIEEQTRIAINDTNFVMLDTVNNQLKLSMLFKWYKADFEDAGGVLLFINKYRETPVTYGYEIVYRSYDWSLNDALLESGEQPVNVQNFTPSILLDKGRWEYKSFLNMYTQNKQFMFWRKQRTARSTYLTWINQISIGINKRINVGAEFWTKNVLDGGPKTNNPLNVFIAASEPTFRASPLYLGPKVKISPVKSLPRISLQSTFLIPVGSDFEGRSRTDEKAFLFLEWDRYLWINEIFWDAQLSSRWQLFTKLAAWTSFTRNSYRTNSFIETPISGFLSYFPNSRFTLYGMAEYWPSHVEDRVIADVNFNRFKPFNSFFFQMGMGAKMQVIPGKMEIEFLATNLLLGTSRTGAGSTFNVGLRLMGLKKMKEKVEG